MDTKQKKQLLFFLIGFVLGILLTLLSGILFLRTHLIQEKRVPGDFQTISGRVENAVKSVDGWTVIREQCQLPKSANGHPVAVFKLCNGDYAKEMLNEETSRKIASVIPCGLAVYTKNDGHVYLAKLNMPLLGKILGGLPGYLFPGKIAEDQKSILERISGNKVEKTK